ncbi:MAG: hypothetical protein AB7N76_17120 [Planctomycetota bacterium]
MKLLRATSASPALRCALCHDELCHDDQAEERVSCAQCGTAVHGECAREHERCPTLACPQELVPWSFAEAMERRDGPLVQAGALYGAILGAGLGVWAVLAGSSVLGLEEGPGGLLLAVARVAMIGAFQGAVLGIFLLFLLRALTTGTPPLRE